MKKSFTRSHSELIAVALDTALPHLIFHDKISRDEEQFLFSLEQYFLDCKGFSIDFNYEEKK